MTKDMFSEEVLASSARIGKDTIARDIVASVFSDEVNIEELDLEGQLPKVCFLHLDRSEFVLQTISEFQSATSKFIHEFLYLEIEAFSELEVESFCSLPFRFFELDTKRYLVTETVIKVKDLEKVAKCREMIKSLQAQLRLGLRSSFYSRMVMEMKGGSLDGKTSYIQERIVSFIHRFPEVFDYDVISLMNGFLKHVKEQFVKERSVKSLSQIVLSFYLFSKRIATKARFKGANARSIYAKTNYLFVEELFGRKKALGVVVALSHLFENERLGKEHLLKACRKFIRGVSLLENSLVKLAGEGGKENFYYFELEKKEGVISLEERRLLELGLPKYLEVHIQKFARKIFMPQNTEEVIKYTVALSKELRSIGDIPQVAVLFDSQTNDNIIFTVILVRARLKDGPSAFELFEKSVEKGVEYKIRHVRRLGDFKEGIEISYQMRIKSFMREDYSVDIYRARARVVADLFKKFGNVRDYNGGMLEKQGGLLADLQSLVKKKGVKNTVLVENFFYAINPSEMRSILNVETFSRFFMNFYDLFTYKSPKDTSLIFTETEAFFLARVRSEKRKEAFISEIKTFDMSSGNIVYFTLRIQERYYLGAYFLYNDQEEKRVFIDKMSICLKL